MPNVKKTQLKQILTNHHQKISPKNLNNTKKIISWLNASNKYATKQAVLLLRLPEYDEINGKLSEAGYL